VDYCLIGVELLNRNKNSLNHQRSWAVGSIERYRINRYSSLASISFSIPWYDIATDYQTALIKGVFVTDCYLRKNPDKRREIAGAFYASSLRDILIKSVIKSQVKKKATRRTTGTTIIKAIMNRYCYNYHYFDYLSLLFDLEQFVAK